MMARLTVTQTPAAKTWQQNTCANTKTSCNVNKPDFNGTASPPRISSATGFCTTDYSESQKIQDDDRTRLFVVASGILPEKCGRVQPLPSRRQGSIKPRIDDSLFRPFFQDSHACRTFPNAIISSERNTARTTPKRKAKKHMSYFNDNSSQIMESSDGPCSDWRDSTDRDSDTENEFMLLEPAVKGFKSPSLRPRRKPLGRTRLLNALERYSRDESSVPSSQSFAEDAFNIDSCESKDTSDTKALSLLTSSPPRPSGPSTSPKHPLTPRVRHSKSKLASPRKIHHIPPTPHRPSIDLFWNQEVINEWNDEYSPRKLLRSPSRKPLPENYYDGEDEGMSPLSSPRKSPSKAESIDKRRSEAITRKAFNIQKHGIAEKFIRELDYKITGGEIEKLAAPTGGIQLIWSKKLNSTAGRANWRREAITAPWTPFENVDMAFQSTRGIMTMSFRQFASIELAEKVVDNEERLLNVLAHEFCHLANFMISKVKDQPHGASFKSWAAKVTNACRDHRSEVDGTPVVITVTTKHSYAISYKYAWKCSNVDACGVLYERHSRSIDPTKHSCGKCRSKLMQIRPIPRKTGGESVTDGTGTTKKSAYQVFVKLNFGVIKKELGPGTPHKQIMQELSTRYKKGKESQVQLRKGQGSDIAGITEDTQTDSGQTDAQLAIDKVSRLLDFLDIGEV